MISNDTIWKLSIFTLYNLLSLWHNRLWALKIPWIVFIFELYFLLYKKGTFSLFHTQKFDFKSFFYCFNFSLLFFISLKSCLRAFVSEIHLWHFCCTDVQLFYQECDSLEVSLGWLLMLFLQNLMSCIINFNLFQMSSHILL